MDGNGDLPRRLFCCWEVALPSKSRLASIEPESLSLVCQNRGRADIDGVAFAEVGFRLFARLGGLFEDHRQDIAHAVSPPVGGERPVVAGFKHAPARPSAGGGASVVGGAKYASSF